MRATLTAHGKAALQGMPGVGKTQLAMKYAAIHRQDYAAGLWVSAASREALLSGFAALAGVLHLPEQNEADQAKAVAAVRRWLDTTEQTWLLILDNADDLELLHDFLPSGRGHCLLTTRSQDVHSVATAERVKIMEPADGAQLLLRRAGRLRPDQPLEAAAPKEQEAALALSAELGGLPLALDQAGAFVAATGVSLAEYLNLYRAKGQQLRAKRGSVSLGHPHVTETFMLAFEQVAKTNPAAVELLRACAFLHPDAIPEELLIEGALEWGEPLATALADSLARAELFATLNRFSLIVRDPDAHTLSLHRVVQAVLRDELDADGQRRWAERAVRAVDRGFPAPEFPAWPQCERLLPQTQAAALWIVRWDFAFAEGGHLLNEAAVYLYHHGRYTEAEPLYQRALAIRERAFGPDHLNIAISLNNLAKLYHDQGRYVQAEPLFHRALAIKERALDSDHPSIAISLNNMALLYQRQGRYAEAEPLFQRALAIRERALGPDHPDIAQSLNNLAELYRAQDRTSDAEPLYLRALTIRERVLKPHHPDIAESLNNLAVLYHKQGRYADAELLYQRAFAINEKNLDPNHPRVATDLNNLAALYHAQGRFAEAEPLYRRALAIDEHALGPDHPDVATGLENYAVLLEQTDRAAEAATLRERARTIRKRHAQANPATS